MAHELDYKNGPPQAEIQRIMARAQQMRAETTANMMRKLARGVTGLFRKNSAPRDVTA